MLRATGHARMVNAPRRRGARPSFEPRARMRSRDILIQQNIHLNFARCCELSLSHVATKICFILLRPLWGVLPARGRPGNVWQSCLACCRNSKRQPHRAPGLYAARTLPRFLNRFLNRFASNAEGLATSDNARAATFNKWAAASCLPGYLRLCCFGGKRREEPRSPATRTSCKFTITYNASSPNH